MTEAVFSVFPLSNGDGLRLDGELDLATAPALRAALGGLPTGVSITLDLAGLTFIDSSGLHAIVEYARTLNGESPLRLVNVAESVKTVFALADLDHLPAVEIVADGG